METYYEIVEVDEKNETAKIKGTWDNNQEIRLFLFEDFDMDNDNIKVGQKVRVENFNEDSEFFII